jgi:hypothetical protein
MKLLTHAVREYVITMRHRNAPVVIVVHTDTASNAIDKAFAQFESWTTFTPQSFTIEVRKSRLEKLIDRVKATIKQQLN